MASDPQRKQLASLVGLTPMPYSSGQSEREQGISKAGNKHVRSLIVELAWLWFVGNRAVPSVAWYDRRFGSGNKRARKVGIVALARKLLIALWRYAERGEVPEGAVEKDWRLAGGLDRALSCEGGGRELLMRTKGRRES